jgi:glycosyltransferase involved in cell wall biosynthesis
MLVLSISGGKPTDELRRLVARGAIPSPIFAADAFAATPLDDADLARVGGLCGWLLGRLPTPVALAVEAWRRRAEFDVVLSWGERVAFALSLLLMLTPGRRPRHIAILMWPFNANEPYALRRLLKRAAYRLIARGGMDRLCIPAPRQRRLVLERWGIPTERLIDARWPVDTSFWRPLGGAGDMICAVGSEMRDYPTLLEALEPLDIPCHVARGVNFLNPTFTWDGAQSAAGMDGRTLPANVSVGPRSSAELRDLYARSRIVVIPLLPTDSDNGVTAVAEAMAMGRAIIVTATDGRAEVLRDGRNCMLVAPRDPIALRRAIVELWNDPVRCAQLGAAAREDIGPAHGIDQWVGAIRAATAELAPTAHSG